MSEKKKETDWSDYIGAILGGGFALIMVGGLLYEWLGPYVHGTTPADLEDLSLEATPKQVAHALAASEAHETSVRANFRVGAGKPYRFVELTWDNKKSLDAPTSMRLVAEHESEHGPDVRDALARRFHGLHNGGWDWGPVSFSSDRKNGDVSFRVQRSDHTSKPNPLFERQIDAARQIVLEAAFGIAPHASDRDLAELLGTGYPIADVGKIDPATPLENASAVVQQHFPGALNDSSATYEVALDHPLVKSISLGWTNRQGGRLTSVSFSVTDAYQPSRPLFEKCLEKTLGAPKVDVVDYAAGKQNFKFAVGPVVLALKGTSIDFGGNDFEPSAWSHVFAALGSCTESAENTGSRGDAKKK